MRYNLLFITLILFAIPLRSQQNKGELANLVCFVRFADEDESIFDKTIDHYEQLFNDEGVASTSVYNYFQQASYQQLKWKSVMYPLSGSSKVISYKAKQSRAYYMHYSSINLEGYERPEDALSREQSLIKEITDYLDSTVPAGIDLDKNKDGVVDNICFIFSGNSELSNRYMLWPHRSTLYIQQGYIQGKRVGEYIFLFDSGNGWSNLSPIPLNAGVLCHEMAHALGTRDLYHLEKGLSPVGVWDLMSDNLLTPQGMSAYTKFKYCKWIDEIPEISEPGVYTLNPVGGSLKENVAYKIKPVDSDEYFILEYRKKEGPFEKGLPGSGLLVYRIDPRFVGNVDYNGSTKFDEQYLFRPGGTITSDGNISQAAFSLESGRTAFGGSAPESPFYTNGTKANFAIANVTSCGETISFELLPFTPDVHVSTTDISLDGNAGSSSLCKVYGINTAWRITTIPDWLDVSSTTGNAGETEIRITALTGNATVNRRVAEIIIESVEDNEVQTTITITQKSSIIQAPYGLKGVQAEDGISLEWEEPLEGSPVFNEDFEDIARKELWTLKNENDRGWKWQETEKYKLPYAGRYSARLDYEMQDRHQDEWLITPTFSKGATLTFYSSSTAPGMVNKNCFYQVEVSQDGGDTWNVVYDLKSESSVSNKYEKIFVDLSAYTSDNMKVAFHAYDTNNLGLPYWWHVDNIEIYPEAAESIVKEYKVFRNGVEIGSTSNCFFTDSTPVTGVNTYQVKAVGDFGETVFSDAVSVDYISSGMNTERFSDDIKISVESNSIHVFSDTQLRVVELYSISGVVLYQNTKPDTAFDIPASAIAGGVYIVRIVDDKSQLKSYKIILP